jgi:hypothetical protein
MSTAQKHVLPRFMAAVDVFEKQGIGSEAEMASPVRQTGSSFDFNG